MIKGRESDVFYPINGVNSSDERCFFLKFEGYNILLDCGIPPFNNEKHKAELKKISSNIDVILLSHCTLEHVSALPFLVCECNCPATIYGTLPTIKMGEMTMYDHFISLNKNSEINLDKELTNVDIAFSKIKELKYTESHIIQSDKHDNIIIIQAYNSGVTLGGSLWKISNKIDTILYCMDFNILQSHYLNGMDLNTLCDTHSKPTMLIMDSKNVTNNIKLNEQEEKIITIVKNCILNDKGNIVIPCDTSGVSLELVMIFEKLWEQLIEIRRFGFYFLSNMSMRTVKTYASQQLQFMNNKIIKKFNEKRANPFILKHCKLIQDINKIDYRIPSLIIASEISIEHGYSRKLFEKIALNSRNSFLIIDQYPFKRSLSSELVYCIKENEIPSKMELKITRKEPLEGEELRDFVNKKRNEIEIEKRKKTEAERKKKIVTIKDDDVAKKKKDDVMSDDIMRDDVVVDDDVSVEDDEIVENDPRLFLPENMRYKSTFLMFPPTQEDKIETDNFGEFVDPDELKKISLKVLEEETLGISNMMVMDQNNENMNVSRGMSDEAENTGPEDFKIPLKLVTTDVILPLECKFFYEPFCLLANKNSIRNIVQKIKPLQLVLVNGDRDKKESFMKYCKKNITRDVSCPKSGERVFVKTETVFNVRLGSKLIDYQNMLLYGDFEMGYFEGCFIEDPKKVRERERMEKEANEKKEKEKEKDEMVDEEEEEEGEDDEGDVKMKEEKGKEEKIVEKEKEYDDPYISKCDESKGHRPFFIGNVKLNELKVKLNGEGVNTQFKMGGGIICNKKILLTKDLSGKIQINGPLCADYIKIREILYSCYCIL